MKIYLDRGLNFYLPTHPEWIEIELQEPTSLRRILSQIGIPFGEVHLVVVNDEAVEVKDVLIMQKDVVKIFPPFGGG